MPIHYPRDFLNLDNFELAWERILRGSNSQYKRHFRHLFPSFQIAATAFLKDLIKRLRSGIYVPSEATTVYLPKPSRILRPITLLCLNDQIVYQAIANYLAEKFFRSLQPNYGLKTFGGQYAGNNSLFFYRSWKKSYRAFNSAIRKSYARGNDVVADFDLVSFFDLIDHEVLRRALEAKVRRREVLDLLFGCLKKWTSGNPVYVRGHGIPQGPEPSAFLAEILLTEFDRATYPNVTYLRYVDDVKLLGGDFSPVRRALLRLDLQAKKLGLVPQAQKIEVRKITDINSELKSVPSSIAGPGGPYRTHALSKTAIFRLTRLLRNSIKRKRSGVVVMNDTQFKFALYRLPTSRRIVNLIKPLMHSRPDLSPVIAHFLSGPSSRTAMARLIHGTLTFDPVFDAAAGDYVLALDRAASKPGRKKYLVTIAGLMGKSEEKSLLLDIPAKLYLLKRSGKRAACAAIYSERDAYIAGWLIHAVLLDPSHSFLLARDLRQALRRFASTTQDEDLARLCTYLMLIGLGRIPRRPRAVGSLMLSHLGYAVPPAASSFLDGFFKDVFNIRVAVDWEGFLGKRAHSELQRRAIGIRGNWAGNPSLLVTIVDSFNDLLIQRFSKAHSRLKAAFQATAGAKARVPDFGNWIRNASLKAVLPRSHLIFANCHDLRVRADIAHATHKKTGKFTRPVTYFEMDKTVKALRAAYLELIVEWQRI